MSKNIFTLLKSETQSQHDQLESISFSKEIMSKTINLNQYKRLLYTNLQVYQILENQLNQYFSNKPQHQLHSFSSHRLPDLVCDLDHLSIDYSVKESLPKCPNLKSEFEVIGCLYVLEGSRLGGKVITKALRKNEELSGISSFHFYEQETIDIGKRWMEFKNRVQEMTIDISEDFSTKIIASAQQTFDFFYQAHLSNSFNTNL